MLQPCLEFKQAESAVATLRPDHDVRQKSMLAQMHGLKATEHQLPFGPALACVQYARIRTKGRSAISAHSIICMGIIVS